MNTIPRTIVAAGALAAAGILFCVEARADWVNVPTGGVPNTAGSWALRGFESHTLPAFGGKTGYIPDQRPYNPAGLFPYNTTATWISVDIATQMPWVVAKPTSPAWTAKPVLMWRHISMTGNLFWDTWSSFNTCEGWNVLPHTRGSIAVSGGEGNFWILTDEIVGRDHKIRHWNGGQHCWEWPGSGSGSHIALDSHGQVWTTKYNQEIWRYDASARIWRRMPGFGAAIGREVVVGWNLRTVYFWNGSSWPFLAWAPSSYTIRSVERDASGTIFISDAGGYVYYWDVPRIAAAPTSRDRRVLPAGREAAISTLPPL